MLASGPASLLDFLGGEVSDRVPPGWFTSEQLSKKSGRGIGAILQKLRKGIAAGKVEKRLFSVQAGSTVRPVPHYRIKDTR